LIDYDAFCGVPGFNHDEGSAGKNWDISARDLALRLQNGEKLRLIDVREPHELAISSLPGEENIPLGQLAAHLFCKTGARSTRGLELLVSAGFKKVKNLQGGINAWAREVDQKLPIY
jgi:adenylyltransferase/sulfurtransferase